MEQAKAVLSRLSEKSLTDLVRGIRNNKKNEAKYISQCIQEIKDELKSGIMEKKTVAIQKLTYLQMLGYDMSWASFNVIEVMSQPKFTGKRIGYLAASQSFHEGTEVVMLATNLIKKDAQSSNLYDAGVAINCLANVCTPDLARDLASDIVALMSNSKPYVRKKAVLVMYKVFLKFPDSLRPSFPKLKEKLEDPDQAVISSAVNVICELARKNPKNYLSLAPTLFKLLTSNYNNWMLIKIIKLFGALTPLEPRLGKKLVDPLSNLINNTPATSLLYECIQTCTIGMPEQLPLIKLCITKLRTFVEDPDQNLKYLGLLALNNIMKIHPKAVAEHRDLVLACLDDEDVTIRMRALDLLVGMVNKRNLPDIVRKLLEHLEKAEGLYRDELVDKTITLCSQNTYSHVTDFEWYLTVLVQLTRVQGTTHGALIGSQILDVLVRVDVVRPFGVKQMVSLLRDAHLYSNPSAGGICEVLYGAAWAIGEFARNLGATSPIDVLGALLQPQAATLPPHIQSVFMQNALKVFGFVVAAAYNVLPALENEEEEEEEFENITPQTINEASALLTQSLVVFTQSVHIEVQERACFVLELLKLFNTLREQASSAEVAAELAALFDGTLNPVAKGAQRKVAVPEGLDLDAQINAPDAEDEKPFELEDEESVKSEPEEEEEEEEEERGSGSEEEFSTSKPVSRRREEATRRAAERASNPYIIQSRPKKTPALEDSPSPVVTITPNTLGDLDLNKPKRRTRKVYTVKRDEDAPEGAEDEEREKEKPVDALGAIDLSGPLGSHEVLPIQRHRTDLEKERKAVEAAKLAKEKAKTARPGEKRGERPSREKEERKGERERRGRPKQAEGQLIDLGIGDTGSPVAAAAGVQEDYQMLGSPSAGAAPIGERKRREHREGRERREGHREGREGREKREHREGRERREERGDRRGERKPGERRERPEGREHGERKERGEGERKERRERKEEGDTKRKYRPLFNSADLNVVYDATASAERGKLQVVFLVENSADTEITNVLFNFTDSLSARVAKSGAASCVVDEVAPGQKVTTETTITASGVLSQKLKGSITYTYLGDTRKEEISLVLPVSAFIAAVALSKDQFATVLNGEGTPALALNSTRIKSTTNFKATVIAITSALHLEPVQIAAESANASAYGRTVLGQHVAMRVKGSTANNEIQVDIKSSEASIGSSLIQELNALFR